MSEEEKDLELQALQRQLDDAFQTTRPRPSFEDELWLRMQSRRPVWQRLREGVTALIDGVREVPAVPSAAVAIVLIVLVGAGIITLSGLHPGGGASTATNPAQNSAGGAYAAPEFGRLPVPALAAPASPRAPSPASVEAGRLTQSVPASPNNVYFGPATLSWAGNLTITASNLPVFRYQEPTSTAADQFATSIGAAPSGHAVAGGLGMYAGDNFTLVVTGSVAQPPHEPTFNLSDLKSTSAASSGDPVAVATAYLAAHSLIPSWTFQTEVQKIGTTVRVRFLRSFDVPAQGQGGLIDSLGDHYGIEVDTATSSPGAFETGPLPLTLDSVNYPIINSAQAIRIAVASSASSSGTTPVPVVHLTKVELVYKLVVAADHSFYEPAFLFSGTFTDHGTTYVKRVLVPAVDPSLLSP